MRSVSDQLHVRWRLLLLLLAAAGGCGGDSTAPGPKADRTSAVPRVVPPRQATPAEQEPAVEKVSPVQQPRRPVGPWLQWQVADLSPIEGQSYLSLIVNPGAESVVRLTSYDAPDHEEYPSLFIQALTKATSLQELLNQKLSAQLFVQVERQGNMLHNLPDQLIELTVTAIDGKNVRGAFSGHCHDVESGGNGPIRGSFQAVVE